jgi:hypothetical protein
LGERHIKIGNRTIARSNNPVAISIIDAVSHANSFPVGIADAPANCHSDTGSVASIDPLTVAIGNSNFFAIGDSQSFAVGDSDVFAVTISNAGTIAVAGNCSLQQFGLQR